MGTSYPATIVFPKDDLMTLVSHGPIGGERQISGGNDPHWRGVGKHLTTASFPAIDYCIPYDRRFDRSRDQEVPAISGVGIVGWNNMLFGFGEQAALATLRRDIGRRDAPYQSDQGQEKHRRDRTDPHGRARCRTRSSLKVKDAIAAGKKDFEMFAYGQYMGNLLGSGTRLHARLVRAARDRRRRSAAAASKAARCVTAT